MKKFLLALVFFLGVFVFSACNGKAGKADNKAVYVPQRSDYTIRTEVRTIEECDEVRWDTIVVYLTDAQQQTQKFYTQALPLDTMYWSNTGIGEITEDDWNFDGIPDLQVGLGPMNGFGNFTYDVWIWDDQTHQFVYLENSASFFSPEIDSVNQCVVSTWRLDGEIEIIQYKWKDGKLVESEREEFSDDVD